MSVRNEPDTEPQSLQECKNQVSRLSPDDKTALLNWLLQDNAASAVFESLGMDVVPAENISPEAMGLVRQLSSAAKPKPEPNLLIQRNQEQMMDLQQRREAFRKAAEFAQSRKRDPATLGKAVAAADSARLRIPRNHLHQHIERK